MESRTDHSPEYAVVVAARYNLGPWKHRLVEASEETLQTEIAAALGQVEGMSAQSREHLTRIAGEPCGLRQCHQLRGTLHLPADAPDSVPEVSVLVRRYDGERERQEMRRKYGSVLR